MATGSGLEDRLRVPVGTNIFLVSISSSPVLAPLLSNGYRGDFSPGIKPPGREAVHSPPTNAKVKNTSIYTSTPIYASVA
jgi:hypothetical protein